MEHKEYVFESTDKYLHRLDDVLAGRTYRLAMDNGEELELRFVTPSVVEWRRPGEELRWERYGCLQAGEGVVFAAAILQGTPHPTCVTLVLDDDSDLVTMAVSRLGVRPGRPRLAEVEFIFGAIRRQDQPLPVRRHGFTRDLVGKKITWHYSTGFVNTHIYPSERYCRTRSLQSGSMIASPAAEEDELIYEEPTRFIKIREGMYLISFIEDHMNRADPVHGGNNLMVLTNLKEGYDSGRTFSFNSQGQVEHGLFRAFGEFTEEDIPVEHEPSPYRVEAPRRGEVLVIGADTSLGRRIAKDALHRGYAVTAAVRDRRLLDSVRYRVLESADYAADTAGYDAVIDARSTTVTVTRGGAVSTLEPPAELDAAGRRQGAYRVVSDGRGTYIGEEDFALAAVDEAGQPDARRFSVESDRAPAQPEEANGRRRYVAVPDTGIAGQVYDLAMDDGQDYVLHFLTDDSLLLAKAGAPFRRHDCRCLHCDDSVWFVVFQREGECVTLLLDQGQRLATAVYAEILPRRMNLVRHRFLMGAIRVPGEKLPFRRHGFTDALAGEKITWHYSPYVNITHCYVTESYMRNSLRGMKPLPADAAPEAVHDAQDRIRRWGNIFFEEPAQYLAINDHLFVVCLMEANRNRMDPLQGGGDMVLAINTRRMRDYGRGFHTGLGAPSCGLISVSGDWDDLPDEMDSAVSPYLVDFVPNPDRKED